MTRNLIFLLILPVLLMPQSFGQADRQSVGNLTYVSPAGWTAEPRGNSVVLRPNDAARSRVCMVVITTGLDVRGDFKAWAEQQWTVAKGTRREVTRQDIPPQTDGQGMEALAIAATLQIGSTPKQYHLFSAFHQDNKGATLSFVTDGEDYVVKYEAAVEAISGSIKFSVPAGLGTAPTPTPSATVPAMPSPTPDNNGVAPTFDFPQNKVRTVPRDLPVRLPEPMAMPPGSPDLAAKILAQKVLEGGDEAIPALMRAVLAAGHPIVKSDGTVLFSPDPGTSNGIGILDAEVVFATQSAGAEATVAWGGIGSVIQMDSLFKGFDMLPYWRSDLEAMVTSPDASYRFWAAFIKAIATESDGLYTDPAKATSNSPISPIQAHLFLLRSFGALQLARGQDRGVSEVPSKLAFKSAFSGPNSEAIETSSFQDLTRRIATQDLRRMMARDPNARNIFNALSELLRRERGGAESEAYLLVVTQRLWIMNFLKLEVGDAEMPLVRTKVFGMRGEQREYPVRLMLEIPPAARQHFEEYARELGVSAQIPSNGQIPFGSDVGFRPFIEPLTRRSAELIEIKSFELPSGSDSSGPARLVVEGAQQQKNLPDNAEEDPKTAEIRLSMEPIGAPGSRPRRDRMTIWQIVASELQSTYKFDIPLPVTDWKGSHWTGSIMVRVNGSGAWNSPDMKTQLGWRITRGFYTEFELDGSATTGLIGGTVRTNPTARGNRQYSTNFPKRNPPVNLLYDDYIKLKALALKCGPDRIEEEEVTTLMEAKVRKPKGFNEEVLTGTHRGVYLQQEAVEGITAIQLWQDPPPVPVTERVETTVVSTTRSPDPPPVIKDKVVKLLNRIRINRAGGPFVVNNAVVKRTPAGLVVEDGINDYFELDLGLKPGSPAQKIKVEINWKFELVGGTSSGALAKAIEQALAFASFRHEIDSYLSAMQADESPSIVKVSVPVESDGVASCSLASHRIAGKLSHQPKTAAESRPRK